MSYGFFSRFFTRYPQNYYSIYKYSKRKCSIWKYIEKDVKTLPNLLSFTRIALGPVTIHYIEEKKYNYGLYVTLFAAITDVLDGFIARGFPSQKTIFGSILDPFADKFFMACLTVALAKYGLIPTYLSIVIIGRDILLACLSGIVRYHIIGSHIPLGSIQIKPTLLSKFNTFLQLFTLLTSLIQAQNSSQNSISHPYMHYLWVFCASVTTFSGLDYIHKCLFLKSNKLTKPFIYK